MMNARVDATGRVSCNRDGCGYPLGHVTTRRWWPPSVAWEQVVDEDGKRFWRQARERGRKGQQERSEARGRRWLPGWEGVGRGPLGVDVECPKCSTLQLIDGVG